MGFFLKSCAFVLFFVFILASGAQAVVTGTKWVADLSGCDLANSSSVSADAEHVYVSCGNRLFKLLKNGTLKKTFEIDVDKLATPMIFDNGDVLVAGAKNLYSLNEDFSVKFKTKIESSNSGILSGDQVNAYLVEFIKGKYGLTKIDKDGTIHLISESIQKPPAINSRESSLFSLTNRSTAVQFNYNGDIYVQAPINSGKLAFTPTINNDGSIIFIGNKQVVSLKPDLTLHWSFPHAGDEWSMTGPAVVDSQGTVFFSHNSRWKSKGFVWAINKNGTLKWKYEFDDVSENEGSLFVSGSPVVGDDNCLYTLTSSGISAFNKDSGERLQFIKGYTPVWGNALTMDAEGVIYAMMRPNDSQGDPDRMRLYAFATTATGPDKSSWPMWGANPGHTFEANLRTHVVQK